jgi:hypothetical protein
MNTGQALRAVRTFATGCVVAAAVVTGTASMTVTNSAGGDHGGTSSLVQAKKEWKQPSSHDVVLAKKEYKQLITPTQPEQ